jgi:hypothetical protein
MGTKITPQDNGPIRIEGKFEILDPRGSASGLSRSPPLPADRTRR